MSHDTLNKPVGFSDETLHHLIASNIKNVDGVAALLEAAIKNGEPTAQLRNRLHQATTALSAIIKESKETRELAEQL